MPKKFDMQFRVDAQLKSQGLVYDANETAVFSRQLEYVHSEVQRAKYPDLKYRDAVPIKSGAPIGATSHRWFELDEVGEAAFVDNLATEDFPTSDLQGSENVGKIRNIGTKYHVTIDDLEAAAMTGLSVETEKAILAKKAIETLKDKVFWGIRNKTIGGFKGIAHDDMSTAYTPHATNGSNGDWLTALATPEKIVHDVRGACDAAFLETKGAFAKFDLFLPPEMGVLLDNPMSVLLNSVRTNLNMTIRQYLLANVPRLRSITDDCFRLTGAGAGGKHRAILYPRDPEVLDYFLPLDFQQTAPQLSGMAFVTHCRAKIGDIRVKHPLAIRRFDVTTTAG